MSAQFAARRHVEMQRAMWPSGPDIAVDQSSCFGVWPANCLCIRYSVEYQTESWPCWRAQMQRVASKA
eukprot:8152525-Pyramimonas_sp.AAC.1